MPLYVFTCAHGHETELLRPRDVTIAICRECGEDAKRDEVYRFGFSGFARTPVGQQDLTQDYRRFHEASSEMDYKAARIENDTGTTLSTPLYKAAKAEAAKLKSIGVTADDIKT